MARGERWVRAGGLHIPGRRAHLIGVKSHQEEEGIRVTLEATRNKTLRAASRHRKERHGPSLAAPPSQFWRDPRNGPGMHMGRQRRRLRD